MDFILIASLTIILLYISITILIHFGLNKSVKSINQQPSVSVLIAARNEEEYLDMCLASIEKIDYPKDKMEVLVINDRSEDNTQWIANSYISRNSHFDLLNIKESHMDLRGKMNALAQGIKKTQGEIILITDADCEVPFSWVSEIVKYFEPNVGMCGGLTVLSKRGTGENKFTRLQALDWIFLQAVASGSCQLGLPISILGNNFAFRRNAYQDVGGFEKLGFSLTEDMALLQAMHRSKKWKIVYPLNPDSGIYSKPVETISEFYHQRKRWVLGGRKTHPWGYFVTFVSLFTHIILIWMLIFGYWKIGLLIILSTLIADISLVGGILKRVNQINLSKMILILKFYNIAYTIIFSIVLIFSKTVKWKKVVHKV